MLLTNYTYYLLYTNYILFVKKNSIFHSILKWYAGSRFTSLQLHYCSPPSRVVPRKINLMLFTIDLLFIIVSFQADRGPAVESQLLGSVGSYSSPDIGNHPWNNQITRRSWKECEKKETIIWSCFCSCYLLFNVNCPKMYFLA